MALLAACGAGRSDDGQADTRQSRPNVAKPARGNNAHITAAVMHAGRPEEDRKRDADRKPARVLSFFGIEPGMQVVDLMGTSGYYTEILARAVGTDGRVYALNTPAVLDWFADEPLTKRLDRLGMDHVIRLDRELEDPGLPEDLDAVLLIRFYHDFWWMKTDRAAVNRAVFKALRPDGLYGIVDHQAESGSGERDIDKLHRIDAEFLKNEVLAAGFVFDGESDILANPDDGRDWYIYEDEGARRDTTDRFVFRFRKPAAAR